MKFDQKCHKINLTFLKSSLLSTLFINSSVISNVILMRHTKLKDDPTVRWREELVSDIILRQVL